MMPEKRISCGREGVLPRGRRMDPGLKAGRRRNGRFTFESGLVGDAWGGRGGREGVPLMRYEYMGMGQGGGKSSYSRKELGIGNWELGIRGGGAADAARVCMGILHR